MVAEFRIDADVRQVQRMTRHIRNGTQRVIPRALNRTLAQVQSASVKSIQRDIPIKQATIRKALRMQRANRNRFTGAIIARPFSEVPIKHLGARQTRVGVTYRGEQGGRRILHGAFIVDSLGGHVFERTGEWRVMTKGRYVGRRREAIQKVPGPWIDDAFLERRTWGAMERTGAQRWPINMEQELRRLLRGYG
jgi:hypothetical protein